MTPPLRIALDGHSLGGHAGGNESYVRGLIEGLESLSRLDHVQVDVYVPRSFHATNPRPETASSNGVEIRYLPLKSRAPGVRLLREMPQVLGEESADVAHFQYVSPPRCPCPFVLSLHDASFCTAPAWLGWTTAIRLRLTSMWSLSAARSILVPSQHTARSIARHRPDVRGKIRVIPLAPSRCFTPTAGEDERAARRSMGLPERYLLYVGRRHRRKNLLTLVDAYAAAVAKAPDLPALCLAGPTSTWDKRIERHAARRGIGHRLRLLGYLPDAALPAVYRGADIFLFPGIAEGFGLPMVEAMACARPVIAADAGALPEVAGGTAIRVPPADPSSWADAILRLARDEPKRRQLGRRARKRAASWSWALTTRRTLASYRDAISTEGPPSA